MEPILHCTKGPHPTLTSSAISAAASAMFNLTEYFGEVDTVKPCALDAKRRARTAESFIIIAVERGRVREDRIFSQIFLASERKGY